MSDKYIIKNCPAIYGIDDGFLCSDRNEDEDEKYCYDCTDCILKRIVELCKEDYTNENNIFDISKKMFAQRILDLLDIQEIE